MQWTKMPQESYDSHCKTVKGLERILKFSFSPKLNANKIPSNNEIIDCFNGNHSTYFYQKKKPLVVWYVNMQWLMVDFSLQSLKGLLCQIRWITIIDDVLLIKEHFFRSVANKRLINVKKINVFLFLLLFFFSYCNWRDYTVIYNDIYVFLGLVCKKKVQYIFNNAANLCWNPFCSYYMGIIFFTLWVFVGINSTRDKCPFEISTSRKLNSAPKQIHSRKSIRGWSDLWWC